MSIDHLTSICQEISDKKKNECVVKSGLPVLPGGLSYD